MRSRSRTLAVGIGSFFLAAAIAAPSIAAKKVISEAELDEVTAAGEPTVITTSGNSSSVLFLGATGAALSITGTAQDNLRALILNNIAGENQVANGVNITSASVTGGAQSNTITQSWGSIHDTGATSVAGVSSVAIAISAPCNIAVFALGCSSGPAIATAISAPGVVKVHSDTGDIIISTSGTNSPVSYIPLSGAAVSLGTAAGSDAQEDLVALIVNNVAGLNQVANGLNISSFGVTLGAGSLSLGAGGVGQLGPVQSNTIGQYNGTPVNWTR
jgi:hypothetical protein